jgi:hypothetical protein
MMVLPVLAFAAMSEHDDFLRAAKHRRRRAPAPEPELEDERKRRLPLVSQGGRSSPPRPAPASPDDLIRAARRGLGVWHRIA